MTPRSQKFLRHALSLLVLIASIATAAALDITPAYSVAIPVRILLLGDSYAAGNGSRDDSGNRTYYGPSDCLRSHDNWSQRWARSFGQIVENRACSGAITDNMAYSMDKIVSGWSEALTIPGAWNMNSPFLMDDANSRCRANREFAEDAMYYAETDIEWVDKDGSGNMQTGYRYMCHRKTNPQYQSISGNEDIILLSLGGNDIGFADVVKSCDMGPFSSQSGCDSLLTKAEVLLGSAGNNGHDQMFSADGKVGIVLSRIATLAPEAEIIYTGYPALEQDVHYTVGSTKAGARIQTLASRVDEDQRAMVNALNGTSPVNGRIHFVSIVNTFSGHEPTGSMLTDNPARWLWEIPGGFGRPDRAGNPRYISGDAEPALTPGDSLVSDYTAEYYHENRAGHSAVADAVANVSIAPSSTIAPEPMSGSGGTLLVEVNTPVNFVASDAGAQTSWSFGDGAGSASSIPRATHTYVSTGIYNLAATIQGPSSVATWTQTVNVTRDGDSVADSVDNCQDVSNQDQSDANANGIGDACELSSEAASGGVSFRGSSYGEPHLVTLDGLAYDLQAVGEFHLMMAASSGLDVQVRYVPVQGSMSVSHLDRVALLAGRERVEVSAEGEVWLSGVLQQSDQQQIDLGFDSFVERSGADTLIHTSGAVLRVNSAGIAVAILPGSSTVGLLGDDNGSLTNDLAARDGTFVSSSDRAVLHGPFANSWRVTDAESLFTYGASETTASYTNKAFPSAIARLSDYTPAELDAANASCVLAGVKVGSAMEACALDLLLAANQAFVSAAAAAPPSVDPTAVAFSGAGVLRQTFDGPVSSAFSADRYTQVDGSSVAAGPFFDDSPYGFALVSVPRHSEATVSARLLVMGPTESDGEMQQVSVNLDGAATGVFKLEGTGSVVSGPSGASVSLNGSGTLTDGTAYRAYEVSLPTVHATDAIKVTVSPSGFHSVLGTGVAVDWVQVGLVTPPPDVKASLTLPFSAGAVQGSQFGTIEIAGGADEYRFNLATAADVLLETKQATSVHVDLVNTVTGVWVAPSDLSNHQLYRGLPTGEYSVVVTAAGQTVSSYAFQVLVAPPAQSFAMVVGDQVSSGMLNASPTPGAGNLESTASKDMYTFSVPAGGEPVVFDSNPNSFLLYYGSALIRVSDGVSLGNICGHREYDLAEGEYRIEVADGEYPGAYWFDSYVKPPEQTFAYQVGQSVSRDLVGGVATPGAGYLESTGSRDVYTFTVPAGGQSVVFDSDPNSFLLYYGSTLIQVTDAAYLGNIAGHRVYDLAQGDYRIEIADGDYPGPYWFSSYVKPAPQSFAYQIGQSVAQDTIGGVATPGAGNLETTASKDVYTFSVPAGGQSVVFDSDPNSFLMYYGSALVRVSDGVSLGNISGHRSFSLGEGEYRLEIAASDYPGGYSFTSHVVVPANGTVGAAVQARWEQLGGASGSLGNPTGDQVCASNGDCSQIFAGGILLAVNGSTYLTSQQVLATYQGAGGSTGGLGAPTADSLTGLRDYGWGQVFEHGTIYGSASTAATMLLDPIRSRWTSTGYENGSLGYPTANQVCDSKGDCYQTFQDGEIISSLGQVQVTTTTIREAWLGSGGHTGPTGVPTSSVRCGLVNAGCYQDFTNTWWFTTPTSGGVWIGQPVWNNWPNHENGPMGYPTANQVCDANGDCHQLFQGGEMLITNGNAYPMSTAILAVYEDAGGSSGALGSPVDSRGVVCGLVDGGCYMPFQNGSIYTSAHTPATIVTDTIRSRWGQTNAEWGWMGYPSGAVSCVANGDCVQAFQHGSMLVAQGTAYPMSEAILTVYEDAGGSTGTLGSPNDSRGVVCGLVDSGCYMPFQNGSIYTSAHTPATIVTDAIRSRWGQTNAEWGWMGYPSAPASCGANGDCVQAFQHGSMLVVASTAYPVSAGIATAYEDAGGSTGPLGTPTDARGMVCGLSDGGCYMEFQHGSIYVSAHTPVTAVTDPIRARWGQTGWETGTLGYPTGPIACDQTTTDCAQPFQNGQILLVAGTAYPLSAAILTAYQTIGGSTGTLGAPTDATGMVCGLPDTGCSMAFQHGTIYTSAHTPAIVVTDPIATGWAQRGGAGGTLGYPTANASTDTNGTTATDDDIMSQTFQGGAITWNQSTGYTIT